MMSVAGDVMAQSNADKNPWRAELCIIGDFCEQPGSVTAPADRSIVIDVFSGECSLENGGVFRSMHALLNDENLHQFLPEQQIVGSSHTIHIWNKQTRLVVPPNGTLRIRVSQVSTPPGVPEFEFAYCRLYLSGYTVK
jgi:hypothetical protein